MRAEFVFCVAEEASKGVAKRGHPTGGLNRCSCLVLRMPNPYLNALSLGSLTYFPPHAAIVITNTVSQAFTERN